MKLQPASKKELTRISIGTLVLDVIMLAVLFVLSLLGIGTFDFGRILLSALCGSAIAILSFAIMCLTVQSALGMTDQKKMKAKFQLSYNARMILQAAWTVIAFMVSSIHFIAGAAPILFPKITILFLQSIGKLMPESETAPAESSEASEDEAASAESPEIPVENVSAETSEIPEEDAYAKSSKIPEE